MFSFSKPNYFIFVVEWHCFSDVGVQHWLPRKRTLREVDQDLQRSPYRQNDLLLLREPDFSQQELAQFLKMPPIKKFSG